MHRNPLSGYSYPSNGDSYPSSEYPRQRKVRDSSEVRIYGGNPSFSTKSIGRTLRMLNVVVRLVHSWRRELEWFQFKNFKVCISISWEEARTEFAEFHKSFWSSEICEILFWNFIGMWFQKFDVSDDVPIADQDSWFRFRYQRLIESLSSNWTLHQPGWVTYNCVRRLNDKRLKKTQKWAFFIGLLK